ncbi:hypothetical protein ACVPOY_01575 [Staphylococcus aureus]
MKTFGTKKVDMTGDGSVGSSYAFTVMQGVADGLQSSTLQKTKKQMFKI